jgi:hypothetical protein
LGGSIAQHFFSPSLEQQAALEEFVVTAFAENMATKSEELQDALRRYRLGSMQAYRTRYLLGRLAQYTDMAYVGVSEAGPLDAYAKFEIEHILPDTPQADLRLAWVKENPDSAYDDYKTKLGNLTLLEKPINIVASNGYFAEKKKEYKNSSTYLTRSLVALAEVGKNSSITRMNQKLSAFDEWNAINIDKRQALLIALALEVWKTSPMRDTAVANSRAKTGAANPA